MIDVDKFHEALKSEEDLNVLEIVLGLVRTKMGVVRERRTAKRVAEVWARYENFRPGVRVYSHAQGVFFGGPIQGGDSAVVVQVQPKARRLWLRIRGKVFWFGGPSATNYDFRTVKAEKAVESPLRKIAESIGATLASDL